MDDAKLDPAQARVRQIGAALGALLEQVDAEKDAEADRENGKSTLSTGTPESGSGPGPKMIPVPDSPSIGPVAVSERHLGEAPASRVLPS